MNTKALHTITAEDGLTQASITPELGAWCTSLSMPSHQHSKQLLYQHPSLDQQSGAMLTPAGLRLCFPTCGQLNRQRFLGKYYFGGKIYELPMHGFVWKLPWEIVNATTSQLELVLRDNEITFASFPFQFIAELDFLIYPKVLMCRFTITNRGQWPMPYYAGFNCYLQTANSLADKEKMILNYQPTFSYRYDDEVADMILENDMMIHTPVALTKLPAGELLTRVGEDTTVSLHYPDGDCLYIDAEGVGIDKLFPFVHLEQAGDQPCLGIHSWMGYPNAFNSIHGTRWLQPKSSEQGWVRLSYQSA